MIRERVLGALLLLALSLCAVLCFLLVGEKANVAIEKAKTATAQKNLSDTKQRYAQAALDGYVRNQARAKEMRDGQETIVAAYRSDRDSAVSLADRLRRVRDIARSAAPGRVPEVAPDTGGLTQADPLEILINHANRDAIVADAADTATRDYAACYAILENDRR